MKRTILAAALSVAVTSQALAHPVGFRNPVADPQPSAPVSYAAMIGAQTYDAVNSARFFAEGGGRHETDFAMKPFSHGGAATMMLGFAATDAAMLLAAHAFRLERDAMARYLASQSVAGVLYTNDHRF